MSRATPEMLEEGGALTLRMPRRCGRVALVLLPAPVILLPFAASSLLRELVAQRPDHLDLVGSVFVAVWAVALSAITAWLAWPRMEVVRFDERYLTSEGACRPLGALWRLPTPSITGFSIRRAGLSAVRMIGVEAFFNREFLFADGEWSRTADIGQTLATAKEPVTGERSWRRMSLAIALGATQSERRMLLRRFQAHLAAIGSAPGAGRSACPTTPRTPSITS